MIKRAALLTLALIMIISAFAFTGCEKKKTIVIYSSAESFRIDYMNKRMKEQFPDYDITDRYAQLLEEQIRQCPELWLWTHNRWKRTREGYEKRMRQREEKLRNRGE